MLDGQVATSTIYVGSKLCRLGGELLTPLEVEYNGDLCTMHKREAERRLVMNKRVGAL